jgi:hypothetical protein
MVADILFTIVKEANICFIPYSKYGNVEVEIFLCQG